MNKLQEVIKAKYGKESQVRFLTSVSPVSSGSFGIMKRDLTLPVELSEGFYVTVIIRDGFDLNDKQKREISDLAGIYLGRTSQKMSADVREANTKVTVVEPSATILPFENNYIDDEFIRLTPNVQIRESKQPKELSEKVYVFNRPSISPAKLAAVFHELAQTWAQMRWQDVKAGISLAQDLKSLGRVTLIIENWGPLPQREKNLLLQWMTELRFEEGSPFFVIINKESACEDLEIFATIDADRLPVDSIQLEQTLDMLLTVEKSTPDFNPVN
ncbi:MAG: hypothetical protein AB7O96_07270 [Pseudobdellovibrionaceae bacterium]